MNIPLFKITLLSIFLLSSSLSARSEDNRLKIIQIQIEHLQAESKRALDESITSPFNGRATDYIKYSRDCNDKITELINSLDLPRKNIKNSFASN